MVSKPKRELIRPRSKKFVFVDDELSVSLPGEGPRYRAVETGRWLASKTGLRCDPITTRDVDGSPLVDIDQVVDRIEGAILSEPAVAIVIDVIHHKVQRRGFEIIEFMRAFRAKVLDSIPAVILISKDPTAKDEIERLQELCPNQRTEILYRTGEMDLLVDILKSL